MDELFKYRTFICTDCGEEIERGIMSWVNHTEICRRDGLNESIQSHHEQVEWEKTSKAVKERKERAYKLMTDQEKMEAFDLLIFDGINLPGLNVIFLGAERFRKQIEFWDRMFEKYGIK